MRQTIIRAARDPGRGIITRPRTWYHNLSSTTPQGLESYLIHLHQAASRGPSTGFSCALRGGSQVRWKGIIARPPLLSTRLGAINKARRRRLTVEHKKKDPQVQVPAGNVSFEYRSHFRPNHPQKKKIEVTTTTTTTQTNNTLSKTILPITHCVSHAKALCSRLHSFGSRQANRILKKD